MQRNQFLKLQKKHGHCSSWAIWDTDNEADPAIIQSHIKDLSAKYIFVAYNASGTDVLVGPWANFRGGKHDRKLKYACNHTELRGSYLTDLFKDIKEAKAKNVKPHLTDRVIQKNVTYFLSEVSDLGATQETIFVILGAAAGHHFRKHFLEHLGAVKVIYATHYSYYGWTDKKWVQHLWKKLGIKANYEAIQKNYQ